MRLFVSVNPPRPVRMQLDKWLAELPDLRKTPVNQLHLTLLFLGDVQTDRIPGIIDSLARIKFEPFEMVIRGTGAFPNKKKPRILWAGVEKCSELDSLHGQVFKSLDAYISDKRSLPFRPHITLARVKRELGKSGLQDFFQQNRILRFDVDEFTLKQSVLKPAGSEHNVLNRFTSV